MPPCWQALNHFTRNGKNRLFLRLHFLHCHGWIKILSLPCDSHCTLQNVTHYRSFGRKKFRRKKQRKQEMHGEETRNRRAAWRRAGSCTHPLRFTRADRSYISQVIRLSDDESDPYQCPGRRSALGAPRCGSLLVFPRPTLATVMGSF